MAEARFSLSRRQLVAAMAAAPLLPAAARGASSSIQHIMVQGRPQDTGSPYKLAPIMTALDALGGVRKMRCREPYRGTAGWATYVGLARAGVKFSFTLSVRAIQTTLADMRAFLDVVPGSIWAIEFPNEPDLNPVTYGGVTDTRLGFRTGNAPALMAFIKDFHAAIKVDAQLRAIPLIASNDYMQAQQAPFTTYGNSHIYPTPPSDVQARLANFQKQVSEGKHAQGVITEWGRTTGGGAKNNTSPPVSLSQQATLLSGDVRAALAKSYVHTISLYELFAWGGTSEMNNFGLFEANGSPRPVVAALRSVLA